MRPAGTLNKNKQALIALLQAKYPGYQPVISMADIANDDGNDLQTRFNAHKEIAQYIVPKLKAVEHSGNIDSEVTYKPLIKRFDGTTDKDDA
jgi:hypothetical protein